MQELRERQTSRLGRAKLRERITVEHSLAHIGQWQGNRARYLGIRKNLFDLRRMAVIHNLHILARIPTTTPTENCVDFDRDFQPFDLAYNRIMILSNPSTGLTL